MVDSVVALNNLKKSKMLQFTCEQLIEGFIEENTYIRIFPSGFYMVHYVIKEDLLSKSSTCEMFDNNQLEKLFDDLIAKNLANKETFLNYFYNINERINISKTTKGK